MPFFIYSFGVALTEFTEAHLWEKSEKLRKEFLKHHAVSSGGFEGLWFGYAGARRYQIGQFDELQQYLRIVMVTFLAFSASLHFGDKELSNSSLTALNTYHRIEGGVNEYSH